MPKVFFYSKNRLYCVPLSYKECKCIRVVFIVGAPGSSVPGLGVPGRLHQAMGYGLPPNMAGKSVSIILIPV